MLQHPPKFWQDILAMSASQLLTGPDFEESELDIDDVFINDWDTCTSDLCEDLWLSKHEMTLEDYIESLVAQTVPLADARLFRIYEATSPDGDEHGVIAVIKTANSARPNLLCGLFSGCSLSVHPEWQNKGIGTALVTTLYLARESLPTWSLDTPAYSHGGAATVESAHADLQTIARHMLSGGKNVPAVIERLGLHNFLGLTFPNYMEEIA